MPPIKHATEANDRHARGICAALPDPASAVGVIRRSPVIARALHCLIANLLASGAPPYIGIGSNGLPTAGKLDSPRHSLTLHHPNHPRYYQHETTEDVPRLGKQAVFPGVHCVKEMTRHFIPSYHILIVYKLNCITIALADNPKPASCFDITVPSF